jgi:MFS family permease
MPHVSRPVLLDLDAPARAVEQAARNVLDPDVRVRLEARDGSGTRVTLEGADEQALPYFQWFMGPILRRAAHRELRHQGDVLAAAVEGRDPPPPPRRSFVAPPAAFSPQAAALVASVAALAALANFGGALFGQTADPVTESFGQSTKSLGVALAVSRGGVLVSLIAAALADRQGRRRMLLLCFVGVCATSAVSAVAPTFLVFTSAQLLNRAFVNAILVVAAIAVVEEAPDGARAYSLSMLALAAGAGFAVAVVLLPLSDIGTQSWRIAFAISALTVLLLPRLAKHLTETTRYTDLANRTRARGRLREVFARVYGWRFFLLGLAAFLTNFFSAPSAQLTNRFLTDEHGFSNTSIALFRAVTNGLPGLFGIVLAGWLAERRGRRPVGIIGLALASVLQMAFFLGDGLTLWVTSTLAIVAAACAGIVLGAFDTELFPTEVRGTSNALLLGCAVAGAAAGLLLATNLEDAVGGLGNAIAICGIAPLVAAALVVPWLPEPAARTLDDISPSEV